VKSKRDSNAIPPEMRCGNKNLSNPDEIANAFADHFAKTFINNNNSSRAYNQDGLNFSLNANIGWYLTVYQNYQMYSYKKILSFPKNTKWSPKLRSYIILQR
jgi:vacuolar-type H+-ATPase subunit B/Vma2